MHCSFKFHSVNKWHDSDARNFKGQVSTLTWHRYEAAGVPPLTLLFLQSANSLISCFLDSFFRVFLLVDLFTDCMAKWMDLR